MNFKSCRQKTGAYIALTIVLSMAVSAMAPGRGRTFAEELQSRNVQLTKPALINALKSTDGEIRYLAAMKLAEDKAVEAVPAILDALAAETLPVTRTNIALALAYMGEERGFSTLEDTCASRGWGPRSRTDSAGYLLTLGRESKVCLNALLDILQSEPDNSGYKMVAAELLPRFHGLTPEEMHAVFLGLKQCLASSDAAMRLSAGKAFVDLRQSDAIPVLQKVISKEEYGEVRTQLEADLKALLASEQP